MTKNLQDPKKTPKYAGMELSPEMPRRVILGIFSQNLRRLAVAKGFNQARLSRKAGVPRDCVSKYWNGVVLPYEDYLQALAAALEVKTTDLIPARPLSPGGNDYPALDMRDTRDGKYWLRVNKAVPASIALRIARILTELDDQEKESE